MSTNVRFSLSFFDTRSPELICLSLMIMDDPQSQPPCFSPLAIRPHRFRFPSLHFTYQYHSLSIAHQLRLIFGPANPYQQPPSIVLVFHINSQLSSPPILFQSAAISFRHRLCTDEFPNPLLFFFPPAAFSRGSSVAPTVRQGRGLAGAAGRH